MKKILFIVLVLLLGGLPTVVVANTHSINLNAGQEQFLTAPTHQNVLDITGQITIEHWVNLDSMLGGTDAYEIISNRGSQFNSPNFEFSYYTRIIGDGSFRFGFREGGHNGSWHLAVANLDGQISPGSWVHLAVSFTESTGDVKFYVNGSHVASGNIAGKMTAYNRTDFYVGTSADNRRHFDGKIDEVRIWNVVRSDQQIALNYNSELTGSETGLAGYWKFNNDLLDHSGNGNHLVSYGATFSTDTPFTGGGTPPPPSDSCSIHGENIDFAISQGLYGTANQNLVLGMDLFGNPVVCVFEVGGEFLGEHDFFEQGKTPVSVAFIPGTSQISVISYDLEVYDVTANYQEQVLNITTGQRTTVDLD